MDLFSSIINYSRSIEDCVGKYQNVDNSGEECKYCTKGRSFVDANTECSICGTGKHQSRNDLINAGCLDCVAGFFEPDTGSNGSGA